MITPPVFIKKIFCRHAMLVYMVIVSQFSLVLAAYAPPVTNRTNVNFNLSWKYKQGDVTGANAKTFDESAWTSVSIPHSTKWVTEVDKSAYIGKSWYRKHFTVENKYLGKKAFIEFEAAMQYAEVWVNGIYKGAHEGGYTPFTFDISSDIVYGGADNVVAVKVNSTSDQRWAPGFDASWIDFQYFGGLYRDVNLYFTDKLHITDAVYANKVGSGGVFVSYPSVSAATATIAISTNVINENAESKNCTVISDLVDSNGSVAKSITTTLTIAAGTDSTVSQTISLQNPRLWHPNTPNLYTIHSTIKDGESTVDYYKTRIGIRSILWTHSNGIKINGLSYKAQGSNMHQDIYGLGNAIPKRAIYYDVKRYKEAGLNFVRGCHYPHSTAFYDACDEFGILVENSMTGWQHYYDTDTFKNNTYKEVKDMIRRDRNHPSVAVWETSLNETDFPATWAQKVNALAHQEFGGSQMQTCGWSISNSTVAFDVMIGASQGSIRSTVSAQPIIVCEYGSWDYSGDNSTSDVLRESNDAPLLVQCNNIAESQNKNRAMSWFSADAYWVFADYAGYVTSGYPNNRLNSTGIVDYCRIPKFSYYYFQSQRDPSVILPNVNSGPMVRIASRWTSNSSNTIRVFSNCEKVSLYRNDSLIATQTPTTNSNTTNLLHPPFDFTVASFTPGTLRAVGLIGASEKAWDTVRTPTTASAIRLRPESNEPLQMGGSDQRLVWIDIVDANGTVVPTSTAQVSLTISGSGSINGPATITMKGGQLATWVRSGEIAGNMTVTAQATGLTMGSLVLTNVEISGQTSIQKPLLFRSKVLQNTLDCTYQQKSKNIQIRYMLEKSTPVKISVIAPNGKRLGMLTQENHNGGMYKKSWKVTTPGVYIVSIKTGFDERLRMVVVP